jgi:hypothetical protein
MASAYPPLVVDWGSHLLGLSLSGGEVHHQSSPPRGWAAEHGLAPAAPYDERDGAKKGGWFRAVMLPSMGEPSLWPKQPEHSPFVVWL